jgi:plastocyanin
MTPRLQWVALAVLLGLATACGHESGPTKVSIKNLAYTPATVDIPTGRKVVWSFDDGTLHTVTAEDNSFGSPPNGQKSGTFEFVFKKKGTVAYRCEFHPQMHGTVSVR